MDSLSLWRRRKELECIVPALGLHLDISRMNFDKQFLAEMGPAMEAAYQAMADLEAGDIANPDEQRQVGHYWLRLPHLAPTHEVTDQIEGTLRRIREFAAAVHTRQIVPPAADPGAAAPSRFTDVLVIGIGGSALGPQLVADALGSRRDRLAVQFMDNTDPDGFDRVLSALGTRLKSTMVLVVSKSGSTPETRNGMLEAKAAYEAAGLDFARYAVAITGEGSKLDQVAQSEGWLARFPMWDWVGGRTSVLSAVGLLPAALQGIDIDALLQGAAEMDKATRDRKTENNPAALLALMWYHATGGRGLKDMAGSFGGERHRSFGLSSPHAA